MPSLTHPHQQTSNNTNTNKPTSSQMSCSSIGHQSGQTPANDSTSSDPITQALLLFEKKQRNLGKRKEKLESYEQEAKNGKELNKDQKEALAKYGEVIGQIECIKDIAEQFKKIQIESAKSHKRLQKQAAEEKRLLIQQRLREFSQLRYLLDHRPSTLNEEETSLLDELSHLINPSDFSAISRSVDTILSIYHNNTTTLKTLNNRNSQEVKQIIEDLLKHFQRSTIEEPPINPSTNVQPTLIKETPIIPHAPPTTPASVFIQKDQIQQQTNHPDVILPSLAHSTTPTTIIPSSQPPLTSLTQTNPNEYPLQFDTRNQNVPLQEILQDSPFFPSDNNSQQDLNKDHSSDSQQYSQTLTIVNSNLTAQLSSQPYQDQTIITHEQKLEHNYAQENSSSMGHNTHQQYDEHQHHLQQPQPGEEEWQQSRTNSANNHRIGQHVHNGTRNSYRGSANNYHHQQWRGSSRGTGNVHHADGTSSPHGQRQYHDNNHRNGQSQPRAASNSNYRGNRTNGNQYRPANRPSNNNQNQ